MNELLDGVDTPVSPEWLKPDGTIIPESAPENIRNLVAAKKWDNVTQAFDGYGELEKFTGLSEADRSKRILMIPSKEDDVEGWEKVYSKLRPTKPEEYKYENNKSGYEIPEDLLDLYKQDSFKRGQSQKQFEGNLDFLVAAASEGDRIAAEAQAEADKAAENVEIERQNKNRERLEQKWGKDKLAEKLTASNKVARDLGIYDVLVKKGLGSDIEVLEMLEAISSKTGEDTIPNDPQSPTKSATMERDNLAASEAYSSKFHKDHKASVRRMFELSQIIAREKAEANRPK